MSFLRKIRFTVLCGITVRDDFAIYGYVETLVSTPVRDPVTNVMSMFPLAFYSIDGDRIDIQGKMVDSFWKELPITAHVWNDSDFWEAIESLREKTE